MKEAEQQSCSALSALRSRWGSVAWNGAMNITERLERTDLILRTTRRHAARMKRMDKVWAHVYRRCEALLDDERFKECDALMVRWREMNKRVWAKIDKEIEALEEPLHDAPEGHQQRNH